MREKRALTIRVFVLCFLFNGILLASLFAMGSQGFLDFQVLMDTLPGLESPSVPPVLRGAIAGLNDYMQDQQGYLVPAILGLGGFITLVLACALQFVGRRALNSAATPVERSGGPGEEARPSPYPAVQVLAALQRDGRFVDFLQEDLGTYEDAQIGAAVRNIHEGCKKAVSEHMELKPVFEQEEEGSQVNVEPGFDANAIRLTGNVGGDPPFRGILRHKGWKVARMDLPVRAVEQESKPWILSPAEVEIE